MIDERTIAFLRDLKANNERAWFQANKKRYEREFKSPVTAFRDSIELQMARQTGNDVSSKLFRINRDIRFSKDKTPYNTHIHISVHATGQRGAWMIGVEIDRLVIGYGEFGFSGEDLSHFRERVDGPDGAELAKILDVVQSQNLRCEAPELKRVPAPFAKDHPQAELLKRKSLSLWNDQLPLEAAFGAQGPQKIGDALKTFDPLRAWYAGW